MRLYIAGPMTGIKHSNYPAFFIAEEDLRAKGFEVLNPARPEGREDCKSWHDFMRAALRDLAEADGIAMLPGWSDSTGATVEVQIGRSLHMTVLPVQAWLLRGAS